MLQSAVGWALTWRQSLKWTLFANDPLKPVTMMLWTEEEERDSRGNKIVIVSSN